VSKLQRNNSERNNNFNFLRIVFALLVLLSHAPELADGNRERELLTQIFHTMSFGEVAVAGFFLLSGYLIVQSWMANPDLIEFLKKRVLRIYPAFIVASIVSAFIVGPLASESTNYFSSFWYKGLIKSLFFLDQPNTPPVFPGTPYAAVNGSMWTITYEFRCYLLVLIFGMIGLFSKRVFWLTITAAILFALAMQKLELLAVPNNTFLRLASYFFCGGCFFLYRKQIAFNKLTAAGMGIALFMGLFSTYAAELVFATAGAYLLFYIALTPIGSLNRINRYPDVSYGAYLYGWPVQKLFLWYFPTMSPWVLVILSVLSCIALGTISWYLIEKPALRLKSVDIKLAMRRAISFRA
jgi:peptidoglycan/LPS O-acetylase OafA/YrhL